MHLEAPPCDLRLPYLGILQTKLGNQPHRKQTTCASVTCAKRTQYNPAHAKLWGEVVTSGSRNAEISNGA